jgi:hypothetical protein
MKRKPAPFALHFFILLPLLVLTGCGSTGGNSQALSSTAASYQLGSFINGTFQSGTLGLSLGSDTQLAPGGTLIVRATVLTATGAAVTTPMVINFSSLCSQNDKAFLDATATTTNGTAQAIYTANGCQGSDLVTATLASDSSITATAVINLASPEVGSISYVSATPTSIALPGSGGVESSVVVFKVVDVTGNPVPGKRVSFALSTQVGGLSISPASAISNAQGLVQTAVKSGNVPTPVRVIATSVDNMISTVSDELVVSTGLPDQNSFSLSTSSFNPEAWNYDGTTITITARAADQFNNPVPDGTAIYFMTEGGAIDPSCTTSGGACSVTWRSQNPRPANGRSTILAYALGNESFQDLNGNGLFDAGDVLLTDLGEAFLDENENGVYAPGEPFVDLNGDGLYTPADGQYHGSLCADTAVCTNDLVDVRDDLVIVMSSSNAKITFTPSVLNLSDAAQPVQILVSDINGNAMPENTTIAVSSTNGTITSDTSFTVQSTTAPYSFSVIVKPSQDDGTSGTLLVKVTTPKGNLTQASMPVTDPN